MNRFKFLCLSFGSLLAIILTGCEQQIVSPLLSSPVQAGVSTSQEAVQSQVNRTSQRSI